MQKRLLIGAVCVALSSAAMARSATFDWAETVGSGLNKWVTPVYTEVDHGVTMTAGGRTTTADGMEHACKFAYDNSAHDHLAGTFTMQEGGHAVDFKVLSIDVSQATGTREGTKKYVRGMLGATVQWEIIAPEDGAVATYAVPTSGDMGLEIDTIEWHAGWGAGGDATVESTIDNLVVDTIPEPVSLGLIVAFGGAVLVIRPCLKG